MQRPTHVAILVLAGACATAPVNPQTRERARQKVLSGDSCPEKQIVYEEVQNLVFVVSGCNLIAKVDVTCDNDSCVTTAVSGSPLPQPERLKTQDQRVWRAPEGGPTALAPSGAASPQPIVTKTGKRRTKLGDPNVTPVLPPELQKKGFSVWGLYKVCVTPTGQVAQVEVVHSAMPGGLDGAWIAKVEKWQYDAYEVGGRPVPSCFPVRLQVSAT
jgi:hypothetical protein